MDHISPRPRQAVRICRVCGKDDTQAFFADLVRTRCRDCHAKFSSARKQRIAEKKTGIDRSKFAAGGRRKGESSEHLAWIRTHRCLVGDGCGIITHAHHVRSNTGAGTGYRPDDRWAVPLCPKHHAELHQKGAKTFEAKYCLNLRSCAEALADQSPVVQKQPIIE